MLYAAVAIGGLGLAAALALGVAAKVFYVEVDPLVMAIEEALPGANCGGCGQPGCSGAAVAIAQGKMPPNACVAGGAETAVAVAAIMGVEVKETEPEIARVGCRYPIQRADTKFEYHGVTDCRAAVLLYGGPKECPVGCIGLGSCVKSCPFDALEIGPDNLPVVNEDRCTGCGTCVRTCPMNIMQLTSVSNRILNEYDWEQCTAPCQRRCPAGIDIPEQIHQTHKGNYAEALMIIKERNPLPLICGRICPHPCEIECRRNLVDEPVAINHLKRFVADYERTSGVRSQPYKAPATGRKAAVIGGGVEGLSAAYFLARLGHEVKIYEAREKMGGLLRTAIPESRLPRDVLDWEIEGILDMGVEAQTGAALGRDFQLTDLFGQGYETVLVAVGGWDAQLTPGQTMETDPALPKVHLALPLSLALASGKDIKVGQKVAMIGGGRDMLKLARRLIEKGVDEVTILCRRPRKETGVSFDEAVQAAAEGIKIIPSARIISLHGQGNQLTGLTYATGLNSVAGVEADAVVAASGRLPEMIIRLITREGDKETTPAPEAMQWDAVPPYSPGSAPVDLFARREAVSDHWAAVDAIGAGRRAASSIHQVLSGQEIHGPEVDLVRGLPMFGVDQLENLYEVGPRQIMPEIGPEEQVDLSKEVAVGMTEEAARAEASRCLGCGLICYVRTRYH
jgi:formate dehydrogenase beta subunit